MFQPKQIPGSVTVSNNMDPNLNSSNTPTLLLHKSPPSSIPGLRPYHTHTHTHTHLDSTHSTPSSEESNSPTELNSYKRLVDKPPLVKRLVMGLSTPDGDNSPLPEPLTVRDPAVKLLELENSRYLTILCFSRIYSL